MSERSSEEIVQLAQQRLAERQAQERQQAAAAVTAAGSGRGWRLAFAALLGVMLLGLLIWPGTPLNWKMYAVVHGVCAQIHNVELGGAQLPLCARNTGIYAGFLITTIYLGLLGRLRAGKLPPIPVTIALALFVVILGIDGVNSMLRDMFLPHLYIPRNDLRTATGLAMGVSLSVMLLLILNVALRSDVDREQRVLGGWGELLGALGVNVLAWAAIYGNVGVLYWPIAITAWTGIVGILFCVNLLVVAIVVTAIELGLLSWARFWLEGQGMVM
jgi:uncharacterized membrane protein